MEHHRNPAEFRRDHDARRDQFERETALPLGAALIIIVLSSLGTLVGHLVSGLAISIGVG